VVGEIYERRKRWTRGPAAILDLLFVAPAHHRRGAGKSLVDWGIAKADEYVSCEIFINTYPVTVWKSLKREKRADIIARLGLKAFVEASVAGMALYESCGFVVTENVMLDGGMVREEWASYDKLPFIWMEREPKGGTA